MDGQRIGSTVVYFSTTYVFKTEGDAQQFLDCLRAKRGEHACKLEFPPVEIKKRAGSDLDFGM